MPLPLVPRISLKDVANLARKKVTVGATTPIEEKEVISTEGLGTTTGTEATLEDKDIQSETHT